MFGTLGFSELIIILAIILIIFGAGRLPQIGEGLGKALKGFKKEVHDVPSAGLQGEAAQPTPQPHHQEEGAQTVTRAADLVPEGSRPSAPYQPGPELTPGTTAALMATAGPQLAHAHKAAPPQPTPASAGQPVTQQVPSRPSTAPPTMEERLAQPPPVSRGTYPPLPPSAQAKPVPKRPSAIVNKDAVARVQAQQAAMRAKAAQTAQKTASGSAGVSPQDMQSLGEGLGDALRTFRQAVSDVKNSIDPEMRTIQAEMDAAQKEIEQSIEAAKQMPAPQNEPSKPT